MGKGNKMELSDIGKVLDIYKKGGELDKIDFAVRFAKRIVKKGFNCNHLEMDEAFTLNLYVSAESKRLKLKIKAKLKDK